MASSCQKDQAVNTVDENKAVFTADSALALTSPENSLAVSGTLTLQLHDSTYTFNAAEDSVAFVTMRAGSSDYFGITAINKAHTISFGLSSKGNANVDTTRSVEGSQLLLRPDEMHIKQYTLTRYTKPGDAGTINLSRFRQDSVLASGTFFTFLSTDDKASSPFYRVQGTFNLKLK
ncbi:hypothetical protein [Mucilaginibacter segetis]|uniref:Uncharacterized protein n=1 Tax=Mucilaginibacter segetis TaxID=2793071 RepID=A0A934PSC2_9SPHI|nr:hypothetical protein [Mucilaginibacter segetis]MBK0378597.1 hypothetical protein [Mucilaginibacter segetis]